MSIAVQRRFQFTLSEIAACEHQASSSNFWPRCSPARWPRIFLVFDGRDSRISSECSVSGPSADSCFDAGRPLLLFGNLVDLVVVRAGSAGLAGTRRLRAFRHRRMPSHTPRFIGILENRAWAQIRLFLEHTQFEIAWFYRASGEVGVTKRGIFGTWNRVFLRVPKSQNWARGSRRHPCAEQTGADGVIWQARTLLRQNRRRAEHTTPLR
jgi:hypothetical protein